MAKPGQRFQVITVQDAEAMLAAIWTEAAAQSAGTEISRAANRIDAELARDPYQGYFIGDPNQWAVCEGPLVACYEILADDLTVLIHRFERSRKLQQ
ncbi:MAG: hypothetical protein KF708_09555 [Pirellulales bacterium]|nr:hypothetical protein [Pirellulales bacterium]